MKFTTRKVKAHEILKDDRIKIGGKMFRVVDLQSAGFGSNRRHIILVPYLNESPLYERVGLFIPETMKVKIYNQK